MTVSKGPTQARALVTRRRILNATFDALSELGYARTTTQEACRRAEVSRGTLLHHFSTRAELVTAAVEHVFQLRLEEFESGFRALPASVNRGDAAIDLLWRILSGPTYYAWVELLLAARTDRELLTKVRDVMDRFGPQIDRVYREIFPPEDHDPNEYELGIGIVFAALNGLAIDRIYRGEDEVAGIVSGIKMIAQLMDIRSSEGRP